MDILVGGVGGVVALPVMAVIAILVLARLGRPVLFVQERAGLGRRPFRMMKFRTMSDARDDMGVLLGDRERTSRFGKFLRRTRLDELPELWNVLIGDMSVIGPRPLLPVTIEAMGEEGARRCLVRPGLTGWAQVSGNAGLTNEDKLALDLWYIRNRSLALDFRITLGTLKLIALGDRVDSDRVSRAREKPSSRS